MGTIFHFAYQIFTVLCFSLRCAVQETGVRCGCIFNLLEWPVIINLEYKGLFHHSCTPLLTNFDQVLLFSSLTKWRRSKTSALERTLFRRYPYWCDWNKHQNGIGAECLFLQYQIPLCEFDLAVDCEYHLVDFMAI